MVYYLLVFMAIKLNLDSSMILEKQFDGQLRGYNALQVDKFLDTIIKDYKTIEENYLIEKDKLDQLKKENASLQKELDEIKVENNKYKTKVANIKDSNVVNSENLNMVKKINAYEKFLYNHGYDPTKIK